MPVLPVVVLVPVGAATLGAHLPFFLQCTLSHDFLSFLLQQLLVHPLSPQFALHLHPLPLQPGPPALAKDVIPSVKAAIAAVKISFFILFGVLV